MRNVAGERLQAEDRRSGQLQKIPSPKQPWHRSIEEGGRGCRPSLDARPRVASVSDSVHLQRESEPASTREPPLARYTVEVPRLEVSIVSRREVRALQRIDRLRPGNGESFGSDRKGKPILHPIRRRALRAALLTEHHSPVHIVPYRTLDTDGRLLDLPRLTLAAMQQLRQHGAATEHPVAFLDFDLHEQPHLRRTSKLPWGELTQAALEETRTAMDEAVSGLRDRGLPLAAFYATKHGARFLHALSKAVPSDEWRAWYLGLLDVYRDVGLVCDRSCADPTRLFAAPKITRDDGSKSWEDFGHVLSISSGEAEASRAA